MRSTIFVTLLTLLMACSNVKEVEITEENKESVLEDIKNSRDLTVEEVQLLQGYILREGLKDALSGKEAGLPTGKTLGEMIEEQRAFVEDEKIRQEEERKKREAAKAEEERQRKALTNALDLTVYEKGFQDGKYQDYITIKVSCENTSTKEIRGFAGKVLFKDLFDDHILSVNLKEDDPLEAEDTRQLTYTLEYNQFVNSHQKLRNTELDNLKTEWMPETILFTDGSSLKVQSDQ